MPVIINDFEIMVEPLTPTSGTQPGSSQQQQNEPMPSSTLRPQDIERIICHFEQRRERIHAD